MKSKNKIMFMTLAVMAGIFLMIIGVTYTWFNVIIKPEDEASTNVVVKAANLGTITFYNGEEISMDGVYPGWCETKKVSIKSEDSTVTNDYSVYLNIAVNELEELGSTYGYVTMKSTVVDAETQVTTGSTGTLDLQNIQETSGKIFLLGGELGAGEIHTYNIEFCFPELGIDQNSQQGKAFNAYLSAKITSISYSSQKEITEDSQINEGSYSSITKDENAILVNGDIDVNISNIEVSKTGDSDVGGNTSFYGTNSAILAKSSANLTLDSITVTTDATGANGVFSYGGSATTNNSSSDGTTITIIDSNIYTKKDNSCGIVATGGGSINDKDGSIETSGTSSPAIRADRGGGTVILNGTIAITTGQGSPTIYSTADITVIDSTLKTEASDNIFLYQSMSGDAANGKSVFTARNSRIITNKGDTFYITNTSSTINLTMNTIINNDLTGNFLRAQADSWGTSGSNGADVTLNMTSQNATGNIVIDEISTLILNIKEGSYFEGNINKDNTAKSITLNLDTTSKIKLTEDAYVSEFTNSNSTNSNIDFNGYKLYVNGTAIN